MRDTPGQQQSNILFCWYVVILMRTHEARYRSEKKRFLHDLESSGKDLRPEFRTTYRRTLP